MDRFQEPSGGFSLIELIITITIIGILVGLVVFTPKTFLIRARDQERSDDARAIARRLEEAYNSQDLGYPAYPSTLELSTDINAHARTMDRIPPDVFKSPGGTGTNNITAAGSGDAAGGSSPTLTQYIYQPLTASGTLCTANPSTSSQCVRYFLYYRSEANNKVNIVKSIHQQ